MSILIMLIAAFLFIFPLSCRKYLWHRYKAGYDRAAQFSPFAALTGHSAAIAETGRLTDQRMELDEYEMARVDAELQRLQELLPGRPTASITYFVPDERKNGGSYQTVTGEVKRIDAVKGVIQMADRQCIPIADVFSIEIVP